MAMNFIKKVFSFGRKKPAEEQIEQSVSQQLVSAKISEPVVASAPETLQGAPVEAPLPVEIPPTPTPELKPASRSEQPPEPEPATVSKSAPDMVADEIADSPEIIEPAEIDNEIVPEQEEIAEVEPEAWSEKPEAREPAGLEVNLEPESVARPNQVRVGRDVAPVDAANDADSGEDGSQANVNADKKSWWQKLRHGLARSSSQLSNQITGIFTHRKLDDETLQDLEDVLIQADLGVETALRITDTLSAGRYGKDISSAEVVKVMASEIEKVLGPVARPLELDLSHKPHVILVVGVNGTGKTTTIGKLAAKLSAGGLKVTLGAGDTFRAAAIEQLKVWGERTGSPVVSTRLGADAAGLAYEAVERARDNGSDVVIIDTAGRLQNKAELMDELSKIVRAIGKVDPEAPHTVLQTLDATTGQNALSQVEIFRNVAGVNGLVMTKLDGTARGGILVAIAAKHKLPVYFIGVGEGVDDLEPFEAKDFATAIVGDTE